ncbi:hypothetical protein vseg_003853 [Gypsophila vaccaria]
MFLVYDYVERGSLGKVLYSDEAKLELGWERRLNVIRGLAHAAAYLHHDCAPPIVHRDISINNILLDDDFEPRLTDFGTAKFLSSDTSSWTTVAGSYGYMAPELAQTMRVTAKCDVYSYGVIVLEVMMGKHPGDVLTTLSSAKPELDTLLRDALDQCLSLPRGHLAEEVVTAVTLALLCTNSRPELRPTMRYVAQELSSRPPHYLSESSEP